MFNIGDKIAYPMHGAGTVEGIEDREVLGSVRSYYIIRVLNGNMQVMVPVEGSEAVGLRSICSKADIEEVLVVLGAESTAMDDNWNRRNRDNMDKLKTGDLKQVAEVIRNLVRCDRIKKLSTGEKKLLNNAKQILSSEMVLINGCTQDEALIIIDSAI